MILVLLPMRAEALSCLPWSLEDAFQTAKESTDLYNVVVGDLRFDRADLPKTDWDNQQKTPPETWIPGTLEGKTLSGRPFAENVTVVVTCAGPWCPRPEPGRHLAFVAERKAGYELVFGACSQMAFASPAAAMMRRVRSCLSGRECPPAQH